MPQDRHASPSPRRTRHDLALTILTAVSVVGVLSIALLAPNVLQLLVPRSGKRGRRMASWEIERALKRLIGRGEVERRHGKNGSVVTLTAQGRTRLQTASLRGLHIKTPARWDRKWRLVFFDIPHTERRLRDTVRRTLRALGFVQIQKSLYLHPYECYDVIRQMQDFYRIRSYLNYAVVEKIEGSQRYRRQFNVT